MLALKFFLKNYNIYYFLLFHYEKNFEKKNVQNNNNFSECLNLNLKHIHIYCNENKNFLICFIRDIYLSSIASSYIMSPYSNNLHYYAIYFSMFAL